MEKLRLFKVGESYTNDQIRAALGVENLGGIRPSLNPTGSVRHVAILTAAAGTGRLLAENPYHDRIERNILTYTAQGRHGDQALTGRNKRLIEQYTIPVPFFGFANTGQQTYEFLGMLELIRHYQESQLDARGALRKVWVFEFRIHQRPEVVPIEDALAISTVLLDESHGKNPTGSGERELQALPGSTEAESSEMTAAELERMRFGIFRFSPYDFEHLIKLVLERSGFVSVSVTPASADGGVDVNAFADENNDFFAGTHVQAQVKRWRHAVGSQEINAFRGALSTTAKGIFVTTSRFTRAALSEARHPSKPSIALIDGERLVRIITRNGVPII